MEENCEIADSFWVRNLSSSRDLNRKKANTVKNLLHFVVLLHNTLCMNMKSMKNYTIIVELMPPRLVTGAIVDQIYSTWVFP